jgi:hypothetical protein
LFLLLGCVSFAQPLRLNDAQRKLTHNSYFIEREGETDPTRKVTQCALEDQWEHEGVRGFELDVMYTDDDKNNPHTSGFLVQHDLLNTNTNCGLLYECIDKLVALSDKYPNHFPVSVMIDLHDAETGKSDWVGNALLDELERVILRHVPETRIFTPADLIQGRSYVQLVDLIQSDGGWPTVDSLRGKFYFHLDNSALYDEFFKNGRRAENRTMWASATRTNYTAMTEAAMIDDAGLYSGYMAGLADLGYLVQCRCDNGDRTQQNLSRPHLAFAKRDCHMIQTDWPAPTVRPANESVNYWITLEPEGAPIACMGNTTVTKSCTASQLESLGLMEDGVRCEKEALGKLVTLVILIVVLLISTLIIILNYLAYWTNALSCCKSVFCCCCQDLIAKIENEPLDKLWLLLVFIGNYAFWIGVFLLYEDKLDPKSLRITWEGSPDHGIVGSWVNVLGAWAISLGFAVALWERVFGILHAYIYYIYAVIFMVVRGIQIISGKGSDQSVGGGLAFLIINIIIAIVMAAYLNRQRILRAEIQSKGKTYGTIKGGDMQMT